MKKYFLIAVLCLIAQQLIFAQKQKVENSLLWKVSGNTLQKPSYLFGTYHFLSSGFIDTMQAVKKAYAASDAIVGELIIDSTIQRPMMEASLLQGTTLKKLLPDTLYNKTSSWFKQEAGFDLIRLDQLNPITVMTAALAITQQKYFPNKPGEVQLDTYFQDQGKKDGKRVLGLETIEVQINALFKQLTLKRQVEMLNETFSNKEGFRSSIAAMNDAYIKNDLEALEQLMYVRSYKPEEMKPLLFDRNNNWLKQLPQIMKEQPSFIAVGALHLVGENGLVTQLRKMGYTVTPINLKN